jgi:uncharacterized repeat protein (TIGR03803 family)
MEAPDAFLYGTTRLGGSSSGGTAFKLHKDGTAYSVIHAFSSSGGTSPEASLTQIQGGLLYGTARSSGGTGGGTIFRMTTAGALFDSAHDFAGASGNFPIGGVIQGFDLALYGTASDGGANGVGVVYRLAVPTVTSINPTSGPAGGGTPVTITGSGFEDGAAVNIGAGISTSVVVVDDAHITAVIPALSPGRLNDVVVTNDDSSMGYLQKGWLSDFTDVPQAYLYHDRIEDLFRSGVTAGCTPGNFCPEENVTRAQMAVFLLKGIHDATYTPPPATGMVFNDVGILDFAAANIEQLAAEGITSGCGGGNYCPDAFVTREQMAIFLLRSKHGAAYVPPPASGVFDDVPVSSPYARWIEQLFLEGITAGCGGNNYCPLDPVIRAQMAVFLVKTFNLP